MCSCGSIQNPNSISEISCEPPLRVFSGNFHGADFLDTATDVSAQQERYLSSECMVMENKVADIFFIFMLDHYVTFQGTRGL
jgi:hypothetical protein